MLTWWDIFIAVPLCESDIGLSVATAVVITIVVVVVVVIVVVFFAVFGFLCFSNSSQFLTKNGPFTNCEVML